MNDDDVQVPADATVIGLDGVNRIKAEQAKINSLRMREEDFKGKPGYQRVPKMVTAEDGSLVEDPSGAYTWTYDYDPSLDTKAGAMVANEMSHAWNAEEEFKLNGGTARTLKEAAPRNDGWTRRSTASYDVGRGLSSQMPDWQIRQVARRAAVKYSTVYAFSRGRNVGAWARQRIERAA